MRSCFPAGIDDRKLYPPLGDAFLHLVQARKKGLDGSLCSSDLQFLHDREALIAGVLETLCKLARSNRDLHDRKVIGALANLARSYQTLIASGLVYQEPLANPAQQMIIDTIRNLLQEFREVEHKHLGHTTLRDSDVLKTLVFLLRLANLHTSGRPLSRGFVDFLNARFSEPFASPDAATGPASRIIMP